MRYILIFKNRPPAYSEYFDPENHFNSKYYITVIDTYTNCHYDENNGWLEIEEDHL